MKVWVGEGLGRRSKSLTMFHKLVRVDTTSLVIMVLTTPCGQGMVIMVLTTRTGHHGPNDKDWLSWS